MIRAYVWWVRGRDHAVMATASAASVAKADPEAIRMILTDEVNPDWKVPGVEWVHYMPNAGGIHITKITHLGLLARSRPDWAFLSIDADTLVLRPWQWLEEPDMWLTHRRFIVNMKNTTQKADVGTHAYNGGVWGFRANQAGIEALIWMRERMRRMSPENQEWWGDQLALYELAGLPPSDENEFRVDAVEFPHIGLVPGNRLVIAKIPCATWNYAPVTPEDDVSQKGILHFKGGSREMMPHYAERLGLQI